MDSFKDGWNMKVTIASMLRMAQYIACPKLNSMVWLLQMGWYTKKPVGREGVEAAPKSASLEPALQQWGLLG